MSVAVNLVTISLKLAMLKLKCIKKYYSHLKKCKLKLENSHL